MADLSRNCREAQARGEPISAHVCVGCRDCPCHMGPPPKPLRELYQEAKEANQ
jgi:hypothetical protein